ncbi:MAG TPA: sulfurtransferase TusA family protein [Caulobacteraceae bacterium]|nr:sulfurtransferase TusA family protein [Caulobacteraceae bacterium]
MANDDRPAGLPDIEIDARGARCPLPTLKLQKALRSAPPGAVARLLADDPMALIDIPHYVAQAGAELIDVAEHEGLITALVRKPTRQNQAARRWGKRRAAQDDRSSS